MYGHATSQQALVDAWQFLRRRAIAEDDLDADMRTFERRAADRLAAIAGALEDRTWRPSPVQPVTIRDADGGRRQLGIPCLEDRIVERAALDVLDQLIDPELLPWSFAYRRGLGADDAVRALLAARDDGAAWAVRGDFRDCFATIPRAATLERLAAVVLDADLLELVRLLVYRPLRGARRSGGRGLHQGATLSPALANLYLDGFDRAMLAMGWRVIRYADDFALPVEDQYRGVEALRAAAAQARAIGLQLSVSKCRVESFANGMTFLGEELGEDTEGPVHARSHPKRVTVFVTQPGSLVRSRGDRLRVEVDGECSFVIAYRRTRQVVAYGRVVLTVPFLHQALARGVGVALLTEHGRLLGGLRGVTLPDAGVRGCQRRFTDDASLRLALARRLVAGKITNLRSGVLRAMRRRDEPVGRDVRRIVARLDAARESAMRQQRIAQLLGVEGSAARAYFHALGILLGSDWVFRARRRRPPPDPVNSLLSFGYSLLLQEAIAAVEVAGLDPYVGVLHAERAGMPGLALDLMEEFRPVLVDTLAVQLLRSHMLERKDFDTAPGPPVACRLTAHGRKVFLAAYERRMLTVFTHAASKRRVSYRVGLCLQAEALATEMSDPARPYQPVVWK